MDEYRPADMFRFDGRWQELAPTVFANLLLTIVTLGFYRFWATTNVRRYLWSHTHLMDEPLEWTGTGKELFIGFLIVSAVIGAPFLMTKFGLQALALRGHVILAGALSLMVPVAIFYLVGIARFRALRYRLSRTWWRGIRGGSNDNGFGYGWSWMWKSVLGYLPVMLLVPWSMVSLWNERWNAMSFGTEPFHSAARVGPVFRRFLLFYLAPFLAVLAVIPMAWMFGLGLAGISVESSFPMPMQILSLVVIVAGVYLLLALIALSYYAAFLREGIDNLSLGDVRFRFEATTSDWLNLFFGDVFWVVITLGFGLLFLEYRHWKFFITHLDGDGALDPAALGQSATRKPGQGEGLLDAFDLGAI